VKKIIYQETRVKLSKLTARGSALSVVGLSCLAPWSAQAQQTDTDTPVLEEVTVTAEHRVETLQKTPASIDVVGADQLVRNNVTDVSDLTKLVPALTSIPFVGPYANITIRGLSSYSTTDFNENAVVINDNGVPIVHATGAHGLFYDLDRVEVLKGPQGTQYGRNATGGVINVIPAAPTSQFGASIDVDQGSFNLHSAQGMVNMPLTDQLYARVAFDTIRRDGYYADGTGDEHSDAGRLSLRYVPAETLTATLVFDIDRDGGVGNGDALLNNNGVGFVGNQPWAGLNWRSPMFNQRYAGANVTPRTPLDDPFQRNIFWGTTLDIEWLTPIGNLTIIPAHRDEQFAYQLMVPTFYSVEVNHTKQDSFEARLASSEERAFRYMFGVFYLEDRAQAQQDVEQSPNLTNSYIDLGTRTEAAFTQLTYAFIPALRVSASGRFNRDTKETDDTRSTLLNFPFQTQPLYPLTNQVGSQPFAVAGENSWDSVTWKFAVDYDLTPDTLLYANIGTGFKAGGFFFGAPTRDTFAPEKVLAYTLGEKSRFLDNKMQVNTEAYYLDYKDQQIAHFSVVPGYGNINVTDNVGHATIKGVDIDAKYLVSRYTTADLSGSFEHAVYNSFNYLSATNITGQVDCPITKVAAGYNVNCSGQKMPQAPGVVVQGELDQGFPIPWPGTLTFSGDVRHEEGHQTSLDFLPQSNIPSYTRGDVSLTYASDKDNWSVAAYMNNVSNSTTIESVLPGRSYNYNTGGLIAAILLPPRTFGVRFHYKF
jgi:iron complex outermembrane recepter protein